MGLTLTVTILGCCALRMVLISLSDVIGKPSFSFSIFSRFRATISSEKKVTGRQTLRRPSTQMLPFTADPGITGHGQLASLGAESPDRLRL